MSISNSELNNNSGRLINFYSGSVSISNSELTYNNGEVICVGSANASIINSTIPNNNAFYGKVIYIFQSALILKDTNITNNMVSSMEDGGIIYVFVSRVDFNGLTTLSNNRGVSISVDRSEIYINTEGVIITNNTATSGGGIFLRERVYSL